MGMEFGYGEKSLLTYPEKFMSFSRCAFTKSGNESSFMVVMWLCGE